MEPNAVYEGDCVALSPLLSDRSVRLVVTSPPYAEQRKSLYGGIPEKEYPAWTCRWMAALRDKLLPDASVFIVIRPHLKNGVISDYVLRTRLALRDDGWNECEELIWFKPDAPPLGSICRPRRTWESVLWFSPSPKPFCDLRACGNMASVRVGGFAGSNRFGERNDGPVHCGQKRDQFTSGTSRTTDVIRVPVGNMDKGVPHPAMYPRDLPRHLIRSHSEPGDLVVDPFAGSGTTCLVAAEEGRRCIGFEFAPEYAALANARLTSEPQPSTRP